MEREEQMIVCALNDFLRRFADTEIGEYCMTNGRFDAKTDFIKMQPAVFKRLYFYIDGMLVADGKLQCSIYWRWNTYKGNTDGCKFADCTVYFSDTKGEVGNVELI